jgi:hypothetical protein
MKIKRLAPSAERLVWARSRRLRQGDRRSGRIEAHRDYLLGLIRRRADMTLLEIQERLIANCGERFSSSVLWRFLIAMRSLLKKVRARRELVRSVRQRALAHGRSAEADHCEILRRALQAGDDDFVAAREGLARTSSP